MVIEIFGLRKLLVPIVGVGMLGIIYLNFITWENPVATYFNDMFIVSHTTIIVNAVILILTFGICMYASDYYANEEKHLSDFLAIYIFAATGGIVMVGAHHLLMTFVGIEILSISLYILAGSNRTLITSNEAGMKYFLMGAFASGILLFGMVLLYGVSGSLHYHTLSSVLFNHSYTNVGFVYTGFILVLIGFLFKISAVPFHFWSPDVYQGSPSLPTAFMATVAKIAAVATLYIVINQVFVSLYKFYDLILILICIATISIGNILAIVQNNIKRMMAYSGISHAGFMLLGILSIDYSQWHQLTYYFIAYGLANMVAFGVAILVFKTKKSEDISAFNGLFSSNPFLAVCLTFALVSFSSIPPFAGFWAKFYILSAAIHKGLIPIVIIAIINTVLSIYFYFRIIVAMYTKPNEGESIKPEITYYIVIAIFALALLVLGFLPDFVFKLI